MRNEPIVNLTVTTIIPTYNRAEYLEDCIHSILGQSEPADEIIVVDDGSTDGTRDLVHKYADHVHYIYQENAGKSAAINKALSHSSGSAVWIVDDDDIAERAALATLKAALAEHPEAGLAFGRYDNFTDGPGGHRNFTTPNWGDPDMNDLFATLLIEVFVFQGATLVRRDSLTQVGQFDVSLPRSQDYDMLLRLLREYDAVRVDEVLFHQRQHAGLRGPAHLRIDGHEIWERQKAFDTIVMSKVYRDTPLSGYLPANTLDKDIDDPSIRARALSRRIAGLVRRSLWDLALADVSEITRLPGQPHAASEDNAVLNSAWGHIPWDTESDNLLHFARLVVAEKRCPPLQTVQYGVLYALSRMIVRNARSGRWQPALRCLLLYMRRASLNIIFGHLSDFVRRGEVTRGAVNA